MASEKKRDVEPLSDLSWQRIERNVFNALANAPSTPATVPAPIPAGGRRLAIGLAVVGAAAVLALVTWRASVWTPTATASAPSRIVTHESGTHVAWGEATLDVAADSAVLVSGDDERGVLVVVDRGRVTCEVAPRRGRPPFLVQAGEVRVRVVGTRFSVSREGELATVVVDHGVVEVSAPGESTRVAAGERWPANSAASTTTGTTSAASALLGTTVPSALPPPTAPAVALPSTKPTASGAPPHLVRNRGSAQAPSTSRISAAPKPPSSSSLPSASPLPSTAAPAASHAVPVVSAQDRYERAARLEASDPNGAIALYRGLAAGADVWASNALFAHGRLEADRGRRDSARTLLRAYLERFPSGPNAEDARRLLDRLR